MTKSGGDTRKGSGSSPSKPAFAAGDVVAGRYRIVRAIGAGSTGEVYEAFDSGLGVSVALKTLSPAVAGRAVQLERFRREVQNARKVTHYNVCRIFDMGIEGDAQQKRFFLTMELLGGQSLAHRLATRPRFTEAEAFPLVEQIGRGLEAAHQSGVVHRDLKPGNIMLALPTSGLGILRPVITDFGLAVSDEQADIRLTESGEMVGTPDYMAPEQVDPGPVLPTADIYAFGLILYEMLSNRRPFDSAPTPLATVLMRRHDPPRPLRDLLPDVDPVWEGTIHRCLERDPRRRFQRARDVVAALAGEIPVMPPPDRPRGLRGVVAKLKGR